MHHDKNSAVVIAVLRQNARISRQQLAREIDADVRLLRMVEKSRGALLTPQIVADLKTVFRKRGVSEAALSILDALGPACKCKASDDTQLAYGRAQCTSDCHDAYNGDRQFCTNNYAPNSSEWSECMRRADEKRAKCVQNCLSAYPQ